MAINRGNLPTQEFGRSVASEVPDGANFDARVLEFAASVRERLAFWRPDIRLLGPMLRMGVNGPEVAIILNGTRRNFADADTARELAVDLARVAFAGSPFRLVVVPRDDDRVRRIVNELPV